MSHGEEVWSRSPETAFVDDGERIVMVNLAEPTSAQPRLLLHSAALIWRATDQPRSTGEISRVVSAQLHQPSPQLHDDTARFVEVLASEGFLVRAGPQAPGH